MAARRPTALAYDESAALDDAYDEPATESWDAEDRGPEGPLHVCLSCGASPPLGAGCEHTATATFEQAPPDVAAAAQRLAIAARAYRECERALKRLATREQEAGRAELSLRSAKPIPTVATPAASPPPCPRCAYPEAQPPGRPGRRSSGKGVAQTLFSFASPPPAEPATPPQEALAEDLAPTASEQAPTQDATTATRPQNAPAEAPPATSTGASAQASPVVASTGASAQTDIEEPVLQTSMATAAPAHTELAAAPPPEAFAGTFLPDPFEEAVALITARPARRPIAPVAPPSSSLDLYRDERGESVAPPAAPPVAPRPRRKRAAREQNGGA
jgi:hypothetical protein